MDNYAVRYAKHIVKSVLCLPDPMWHGYDFEHAISAETRQRHNKILAAAEDALAHKERHEAAAAYAASSDPAIRQGYELKKKTEAKFRNLYAAKKELRILIHVPLESKSPGGYSALTNLVEALQFIGIAAKTISSGESTAAVLTDFKPTFFLVIDHAVFLKEIDWAAVADYRRAHLLRLGLLVQLADDGNSALTPRLAWAKEHAVDFYFSFKDEKYLRERADYKPVFDAGYKILSVPFGGNPLHYYPVAGLKRDLDYVFLGSINRLKAKAYHQFAKKIVAKYSGFIDGPGWKHAGQFSFNRDRDRYIYSRAKVGFNFSHPLQMRWANEVNERTHQLALCGVPQVTDQPKLLSSLYGPKSLFPVASPQEFELQVKKILASPEYGAHRALIAQREAFEKHTTFHRAEKFARDLEAYYHVSHA